MEEVNITKDPKVVWEEVNLTEDPDKGKGLKFDLEPYSPLWAKYVAPFARFIFFLTAAVVLIPFFFAAWGSDKNLTEILDWAKVVLAPVVGFASAVVGYMFGTRSSQAPSGTQNLDNNND